jgi:hypothetical protein
MERLSTLMLIGAFILCRRLLADLELQRGFRKMVFIAAGAAIIVPYIL